MWCMTRTLRMWSSVEMQSLNGIVWNSWEVSTCYLCWWLAWFMTAEKLQQHSQHKVAHLCLQPALQEFSDCFKGTELWADCSKDGFAAKKWQSRCDKGEWGGDLVCLPHSGSHHTLAHSPNPWMKTAASAWHTMVWCTGNMHCQQAQKHAPRIAKQDHV